MDFAEQIASADFGLEARRRAEKVASGCVGTIGALDAVRLVQSARRSTYVAAETKESVGQAIAASLTEDLSGGHAFLEFCEFDKALPDVYSAETRKDVRASLERYLEDDFLSQLRGGDYDDAEAEISYVEDAMKHFKLRGQQILEDAHEILEGLAPEEKEPDDDDYERPSLERESPFGDHDLDRMFEALGEKLERGGD